jgi:hypothetical protein
MGKSSESSCRITTLVDGREGASALWIRTLNRGFQDHQRSALNMELQPPILPHLHSMYIVRETEGGDLVGSFPQQGQSSPHCKWKHRCSRDQWRPGNGLLQTCMYVSPCVEQNRRGGCCGSTTCPSAKQCYWPHCKKTHHVTVWNSIESMIPTTFSTPPLFSFLLWTEPETQNCRRSQLVDDNELRWPQTFFLSFFLSFLFFPLSSLESEISKDLGRPHAV